MVRVALTIASLSCITLESEESRMPLYHVACVFAPQRATMVAQIVARLGSGTASVKEVAYAVSKSQIKGH